MTAVPSLHYVLCIRLSAVVPGGAVATFGLQLPFLIAAVVALLGFFFALRFPPTYLSSAIATPDI